MLGVLAVTKASTRCAQPLLGATCVTTGKDGGERAKRVGEMFGQDHSGSHSACHARHAVTGGVCVQ